MSNGTAAAIVVGVDGSQQSVEALRWAARIAPSFGAGIRAVGAWDYPPEYAGYVPLGSDNFEQEFTLGLLQADEGTLGQIESALERITQGSFGKCIECEGAIPKMRLNAIPYTPVCIKCAERQEGH